MNQLRFAHDANDVQFLRTLRERVHAYFAQQHLAKTSNRKAWLKAGLLLGTYILTYLLIFWVETAFQLYVGYAFIGMLTIFVALNIAHDAAHGTFARQRRVNNWLVYTFDLLGASGYMWRLKHVFSHHPHVNIPNMDGDIKQSNLVRIFPDAPFLRLHRYQFVYMPFLYLLYTLNWLIVRDFRDFFHTDISGKPGIQHPFKAYLILFIGKALFFFRMLALPYWVLPFSFGEICLAFVICNVCASATVALALISAHVGEHSVYPAPDEAGRMPHSWVRHQIVTTCDFATNSWLLTHLFGGFNHHVIHHLFPGICHIHYPALTEILKETCQEWDMPYYSNTSLWDAVRSHFKFLVIRSQRLEAVPYIEM